jgi:hypothetical protein
MTYFSTVCDAARGLSPNAVCEQQGAFVNTAMVMDLSSDAQRNELASFHYPVLPVLRTKDSTALLHCGILI